MISIRDNSSDISIIATECETMDGMATEEISGEEVSSIFTIFNIMCSAIGIGVICIPSTLCGTGIYVGIILIVLFGYTSDWSSRAVIKVTVHSKVKQNYFP